MFVRAFNFNKKFILSFIIFVVLVFSVLIFFSFANEEEGSNEEKKKDFIKWVDFSVTASALNATAKLDIDSHNTNDGVTFNWIELLAYLACHNGGNFKDFKQKDLDNLVAKIKDGQTMEELTQDLKFYNYYFESYSAVLSEFIGNYSVEVINDDGSKSFANKYGIKAFLPIAKNYGFSHYDDFGNSRSYGFKRTHLGNDLLRKYWYSYCCC